MNRFRLTILCSLLCALLIGLGLAVGLRTARADMPKATTAPSTPISTLSTATQPFVATHPADTQPTAHDTIPLPLRSSSTFARAPLMTRPYMILLSRSMFVRGHVAEASHFGVPIIPRINTSPSLIRAETGLVFNGVMITNGKVDALVEDTTTNRVLSVHPGDAVARGKVGKITMESLEYVHDGRTTPIAIGENFTGIAGDVTSSFATSQPANSNSGVSPQDMLEKLRQKRLQELGGK